MVSNDADVRAAIAVTRFGLGARPGEIDIARRDPQGWLTSQIRREGADQPTGPDGAPLPSSRDDYRGFVTFQEAKESAGANLDARKMAHLPLAEEAERELLPRVRLATQTPAGFRERWTLFWTNHFTVSTTKGYRLSATVASFEREAIRPHVFGRFQDMLFASTRHPAMLMYLDQMNSLGPNSPAGLARRQNGKDVGLNENLAREIMELHTVGADAGYTQADVTEFARALTGWSMAGAKAPPEQQGLFLYRSYVHEPGERTVLGRRYPAGQEEQASAILVDLAANPHTATHLARQIATHFVADDPPPALVARLQTAYLQSGGDLAHVATELISAPEAWTPQEFKLKTPYEFLVSAYRAADDAPRDLRSEVLEPLTMLGDQPFSAPQPNGWSDAASDWAAPDAIVKRLGWAQQFASVATPAADPTAVGRSALGARIRPATVTTLARAETRQEAFAILLMSPEFQRR